MAAIAAGMDAYHRRHGVVVEELRVNVPISLRGDAGDRSAQASNAVSIARFPLPIAGLTTVEHMQEAHDLVAHWQAEPAIRLADPLAEVSWFVPVPMLAQAAQASDVTTSNVPGPPIPLYLAGARMLAAYPLVATIGAAVNITMVTYDGTAFVGRVRRRPRGHRPRRPRRGPPRRIRGGHRARRSARPTATRPPPTTDDTPAPDAAGAEL